MPRVLQPAFLAGSAGRLFVSCFVPRGGASTWLLFVPPFAEEMNKSRRMIARLGHALAARGVGLCLPDLYGTGDSEGDFGDAQLPIWEQDLLDVAHWLQQQHGCQRLVLGGMRYGALLAMALQSRLPAVSACLLWQPLAKGQQQLTQFLRLRLAANIMAGGNESVQGLQDRLRQGEAIEVAGYTLAPALAAAMAEQDLAPSAPSADVPVHWLELSRDPQRPLTPVSNRIVEQWRQQGGDVRSQGVPGDPFWSTQELVDAPALIDVSVAAVCAEAAS